MKKYYLVFCCSLLFASCDYHIANDTRLQFTGTVADQAGNPIPEIYLYLEGVDNVPGFYVSGSSSEESKNLGENHTGNLGDFRVVSLKTSTNIFHVNRPEDSYFRYNKETHEVRNGPTNNSYTAVDYINVSGSHDFGTVKLHKKAKLLFKINKTSTTNDTLTWQLSYTHAICYYIFNNGYLVEEESSCHENFSDDDFQRQVPSEPNFETIYKTIIGGTAEFIYQINDEPEQNILLNIDEIQETYVFEY